MPFFNKEGEEIHPEIVTNTAVGINLNDGAVFPMDTDHQLKVVPPGSIIKLLDTDKGPILQAYSFNGLPIAALNLLPGSVIFGVVTDLKTGTQIVDPETEIRVK